MKQEPKLDQAFLNDMYISAMERYKEITKDKHETHSAYTARCWVDAFRRTLNAHDLTIDIKPKED